MQRVSVAVVVLSLVASLACGGLLTAKTEAPPPEPKATTKSSSVTFGVPAGWSKHREDMDEGGDPVVYYAIEGEEGMVQLVLRKAGVQPPSLDAQIQETRAGFADAVADGLVLGDVESVRRELSGQSVAGRAMRLGIPTDDGEDTGRHEVYVVVGQAMSAVVTVDIPDTSHPDAQRNVDEVLDKLVVP